ncbi:MAG: GMC family oxidoreductase [Burkholderiales bacterium]
MVRTREAVFDYVVIGAGTAGCIVASRIAAASAASVCLVEAGGPYRRELDVPLVSLWAWLRRPSRYCWQTVTAPQPALGGRRITWPAGRLVGGSSAINAMIYCRGHPASYDRWSDGACTMPNAPEWSYRALLPYFCKAEDFENGASTSHGAGGPIGVSSPRYENDLAAAFLAGCGEIGIPSTADFNAEFAEGAGFLHVTQQNGKRTSTARYLQGSIAGHRPTLRLGTTVRRILFEGGRATGVECVSADGVDVLRAEREVILCAGTVRSPQLLMLSGIGPADALNKLGIPVVVDAEGVGANLRDQVRIPVVRVLARPRPTRPLALLKGGLQYVFARKGLLTSNVADAAAILRLDDTCRIPQVRIVCRWRVLPQHPAYLVDFEVVAIDPASRGSLRLVSNDFAVPPRIDPGYLTDPSDAETLAGGLEIARDIARSAACRAAGLRDEILPGEEPVITHIRQRADTAYHPVGTCRLGADPLAVVDPWLRVRGVDRLRVVDASVMPTTVAGNAQAAVFAIAERAAEWIVQDA